MDKRYFILVGNEKIECADVDDMTEFANTLLHDGSTELRLIIVED